jgi:hypothetical protein
MWTKLKDWFDGLPPNVRARLVTAFTVVVTTLVSYLLGSLGINVKEVHTVEKTVETVVQSTAPPPYVSMGWWDDRDEVNSVKSTIPLAFRDTPIWKDEDLPNQFYQWQVHKKVTGEPAPEKNQNPTGSCVGFGATTAVERSLVCSIAAGSMNYQFTHFSEEATYAISRVNVGNGRLRGQDGSIGAWAAKGMMDFGMLPAKNYAQGDFSKYDPNRCRQLGDRGLPASLIDECKNFKVGSAVQLKTWTDAKKALANGHGVFVCSMIGFTAHRDSNGICQPSGRWGHCMCLDGFHTDANGRECGHFDNSWDGVYHTGPVGWGSPSKTGFWADARVIGQMISENDSWAVSAVKGFPKQRIEIDWFVSRDRDDANFLTKVNK